ncbi:beta-lactamase domain-containing protein [Paraphoma chrysanthemicola]|uniref:Beta-lactamase domain-containing protein n=1 Tax=Paraphoma chrysanthemicola TaxID=798071 RepID=A0A8K0W0C8_9PLEO|nr:beta-lactamase domain-containing protein [Paraphoma chrysanthemicola]
MKTANLRRPGHELDTLRVYEPYPGIFAYYDGRTGDRYHSETPNWLDDGAFTLGVCTYSIVDGTDALIFDAGITIDIARFMLNHVMGLGVTNTTMVYSHFHNDHISGASALGDTTIVGHSLTKSTVEERKEALAHDDPPIQAVSPSVSYDETMVLSIGSRTVELHHFDIHTPDGTALYMPKERLLFVGDMLEDTATFIDDPTTLPRHQDELNRMAQFSISRILPAHGSPDRISTGGYNALFIDATLRYIQAVSEPVEVPIAWEQQLREVVAADLEAGNLIYFEMYEKVHGENVRKIRQSREVK